MSQKIFNTGNHILVGLGGTGGKVLRAFKMRMFEEFPVMEERRKHPVSILYVDSTTEMMPKNGRARADFKVMGQDASFSNNEFLNIKAIDVEHILDNINAFPPVKGIVDNVSSVKTAIGSLGQAAGQKRRAGRILFAANAVGFVNALRNAYTSAEQISGQASHTTFHIFAGLAGGTGSGAIVDAIVQTRKAFPNAKILAYVMMPEMFLPKAGMDQGRYYPNGYAALNELNSLQAGRWFPHDVTGKGEAKFYSDKIKGVADGLTIYSNINENGITINSLEELPKVLSDYVFARIFLVNEENKINEDLIRAFNFENIDDFALEFDELGTVSPGGSIPRARTKKINGFGIKRIIYPEMRVLKHITYSVGESILFQFKYNNWRENQGFINEERNKDYRSEYLNADRISGWKLDLDHLTLNRKILPSDTDYPIFDEYWHDKAVGYADDAKKTDNPLNELDNIMAEFYARHFREVGVEQFFAGKERVIPQMTAEIRSNIEKELFEMWKTGVVSVEELKKVTDLILEHIGEMRTGIDKAINDEKKEYAAINDERLATVAEWSHLGILQRMVNKGARLFADHQGILTDYYVSKTRLIALEFAKKLIGKLYLEIGRLSSEIIDFSNKLNDAISETERLIAAQQKVNKGLEDMRGAIIEVSEDEKMASFEVELKVNKTEMEKDALAIRDTIIPSADFTTFGDLSQSVSIDDIIDAFDVRLSAIVKTKHDERGSAEEKVLGLNILTQLQQKLKNDDDIKEFASKLISQSGAYLKLDDYQLNLHLRNNEGPLSPSNPASINKKVILVSLPSPADNVALQKFANKLEDALKTSIPQTNATTQVVVNRESPRKDELSVMTVSYCVPIRAIEWMTPYRERYENFLNSGNRASDISNAILLHSEGDGSKLANLFAVENAEEIATETNVMESQAPVSPQGAVGCPPPAPGCPPPGPGMPPPRKPEINLFIWAGGQQYGPYNYEVCEELVRNGQLSRESIVWMEGMDNWKPAAEEPRLAMLFAPAPPAMAMPPSPMPPASMPPKHSGSY